MSRKGSRIVIKGMGSISPPPSGSTIHDRLTCAEPDYTQWIDPKHLRRMSRILRMGVAAGSMALKDAGITTPDAIITGTGYGCLEDTGTFITKMIELKEEALNPTPFIQSTHNTIGAQLALLLQCQGYNQTYTQEAFSFESALLDSILQVKDSPSLNVLVGGVDEVTDVSHAIQKRFGTFRGIPSFDPDVAKGAGTVHGEGAAYFVLSGEGSEEGIASIESLATFYKPMGTELPEGIKAVLADAGWGLGDVDLVLTGACGDKRYDQSILNLAAELFPASAQGLFKPRCGEYPVASAYGLWLAADSLRNGQAPADIVFRNTERPLKRVLILNQYFGTYYAIILLNSCHATT